MPKFHKGDLVAIVPRRLGAEIIDPEPAPGLVKVRIATVDILTGETSVRDENVPENDLQPLKRTKGTIII
ncbi:MAG: hypothetical protein IJ584_00020 [Bacteroidales bacterium]|nr:hypothetical protein [Bacteroidales bacterium]MBR1868614.1 hypothetical protein [Bacteroidales bacterium]